MRHFAQALGQRAKTDLIDATMIARFVAATKPELRPLADEALLADLTPRRRQTIEMRARSGAAHAGQADPQEHRPSDRGARKGAGRDRRGDRRFRARLAGLARKGRPARLRPRRGADPPPALIAELLALGVLDGKQIASQTSPGLSELAAPPRQGTGWRIALGRRSAPYWSSGRTGARLRQHRRRRRRDRDSP